MKKLLSFAFVGLMMGLLLCSCQKSKEEQFIEDLTGFVEKFEAIPAANLETDGQKWQEEFVAKLKEYGFDETTLPTKESLESVGLKMTDDQMKQIDALLQKIEDASKKKAEELLGPIQEAAEAMGAEGATEPEPAPVEEETTE